MLRISSVPATSVGRLPWRLYVRPMSTPSSRAVSATGSQAYAGSATNASRHCPEIHARIDAHTGCSMGFSRSTVMPLLMNFAAASWCVLPRSPSGLATCGGAGTSDR